MKRLNKKFALFFYVALGVFISYSTFTVTNAALPVAKTTEVSVSNNATATAVEQMDAKTFSAKAIMAKSPVKAKGGSKNQWIALALCTLFGYLGVHRFYLGYTWQGVVQLLTAGGCGVWALIDWIRIITGDLTPKDDDYDVTF